MMPAKKGKITATCKLNGLRIKKEVLPSDKMAFPKNACGDISLSSELTLMVDVYACFSTLTNCIERLIRDDAKNRKGEMTANVMTQRVRSAKRYFLFARLLCLHQFSQPGRATAVDAGIYY